MEVYQSVLDFWFKELKPKNWFQHSIEIDKLIVNKFSELHNSVKMGECYSWRDNKFGVLAEIIVLDQFSRNIFRNSSLAFAFDGMALILSQQALKQQIDKELTAEEQQFLKMPFMHSESLKIQEVSLTLFGKHNTYAVEHYNVIKKFGRFPHRNKLLGRSNTQSENLFLQQHKGW